MHSELPRWIRRHGAAVDEIALVAWGPGRIGIDRAYDYRDMDELGRPRRGGGAGKWGNDDGASLVEMAFALPLLIMLVVGMVSAGIAYNNQLALTHAAREGGRYAATLPVTNFASMQAWLAEVADQTVADGTGALDSGVDGRFVCVAYVHPDGVVASDQTARLIVDNSGSTFLVGAECIAGGDGRPTDERRVQVVAGRDSDFNVVFFSSTINLDAEAVNRFEAGMGF